MKNEKETWAKEREGESGQKIKYKEKGIEEKEKKERERRKE